MPYRKKGTLLLIDGLDVSKPGEYISDQSSPNNQNVEVRSGLLSKRSGTSSYGSSALGGASASPSSSPSSSPSAS